jgi:hypothetical protein
MRLFGGALIVASGFGRANQAMFSTGNCDHE